MAYAKSIIGDCRRIALASGQQIVATNAEVKSNQYQYVGDDSILLDNQKEIIIDLKKADDDLYHSEIEYLRRSSFKSRTEAEVKEDTRKHESFINARTATEFIYAEFLSNNYTVIFPSSSFFLHVLFV